MEHSVDDHDASGGDGSSPSQQSSDVHSCLPLLHKRRDVVFLYSKPYFDALQLLPVHSHRELMTLALVRALGLMGKLQCIAPTQATRADLELFHSKEYIDALIKHDTAATDQDEHERFGLVDDAYVFPGLWQYCQFVAGASVTAADALLHLLCKRVGGSSSSSSPSAAPVVINLGGGRHHAMRSKASGFCYINDIVLAIQRLLAKGGQAITNVLCVDMDVHHGDGTQEAFFFSDSVTTVSFHLHERGFFPGTGAAGSAEHGIGRSKFRNVNVPLKRGISDAAYTALFKRVVGHAVEQLKPQVLVLVCGVDTLSRDSLGGFNLTSAGICTCVETLLGFELPLLLLGGGGYSGADASKCFAEVVATVLGVKDALPERIPEHEFYPKYGPDFRLSTSAVQHRPDQNSQESLEAVGDQAIATIDRAFQLQVDREASRVLASNKRKR